MPCPRAGQLEVQLDDLQGKPGTDRTLFGNLAEQVDYGGDDAFEPPQIFAATAGNESVGARAENVPRGSRAE